MLVEFMNKDFLFSLIICIGADKIVNLCWRSFASLAMPLPPLLKLYYNYISSLEGIALH